jgi:putative ABC transport system permease protein
VTFLHRLASIARWLMHRDRVERELDEEMQAFVALSAAEKMRDGVPEAEARRLAVLELGGIEPVKERIRTGRHGAWIDEALQDIRYAGRVCRSQPGFISVVVLTLALGIGANTAIFSLIDALMLRWLPVRNPQELVQVQFSAKGSRTPGESFSYVIAKALADERDIFAAAAGFSSMGFDVRSDESTARVSGAVVTGAYYETLGLTPAVGRLITRTDDAPDAPAVAVLSYGYWQRQFAGNPSIAGHSIALNGVPVTILGVSPEGFVGTNVGQIADVTIPVVSLPTVSPQTAPLLGPGNFWLRVLARPREGVTIAGATARLNARWRQIGDGLIAPHWRPSRRQEMMDSIFQLTAGGTGWTFLRQMYSRPLVILMAMVGLVLLIACANVATMLLARASARQREIAIRLAIGAGRARLVRQMLVESTLLSLMGAAGGIGLAWMSSEFLVGTISGDPLRIVFDLSPNWHVLAFATAVAVLTAMVFGLAPALQATAVAPGSSVSSPRAGLQTGADGRSRSPVLPSLVSAQIALSFVLLVGAGLFVRTLLNLQRFNPGFKANDVLLVDLTGLRTPVPDDLLSAIRRLTSTVSASLSTHTPLSGAIWSEPAVPAGQPIPERDTAYFVGAAPEFFSTIGIPLRAGRDFTERDSGRSAGVAIVNERYAERFFANQNPVGRHLAATVRSRTVDLEIVGVAGNTRIANLRANPPATVYVPYAQLTGDYPTTIEVRASNPIGPASAALRDLLQRRLPGVPIDVRQLSAQVEGTIVQERMMATLAAAFGVLALALASIGLYGLLAFTVARRTREIGIRMALGARRQTVVLLVLERAARLVSIGIVLGVPAAWAGSRWVESMLFGLKPTDPTAIAGAALLLALVAQLAAYVPAWRAASVDPLTALRHE